MGTSSQYYVVELPLRIGDEESRRLAMAFEFGRTIYNATLGQALGKLTHMRQSTEWKNAFHTMLKNAIREMGGYEADEEID